MSEKDNKKNKKAAEAAESAAKEAAPEAAESAAEAAETTEDTYTVTKAQMEQMDDVQPDTGDEERDAMIRKLLEDGAKNGAAGAIWKIAYLSDGAYLAGTDEYLNILSGDETLRADGTTIGVKELELPEKLKNEMSEW